MGLDVGILLQQLGGGIDIPLVAEIVTRLPDGTFVHKKHVPIHRASILGDGPARIIIEQSEIDRAKPLVDRT